MKNFILFIFFYGFSYASQMHMIPSANEIDMLNDHDKREDIINEQKKDRINHDLNGKNEFLRQREIAHIACLNFQLAFPHFCQTDKAFINYKENVTFNSSNKPIKIDDTLKTIISTKIDLSNNSSKKKAFFKKLINNDNYHCPH
jgi:hypothetical protein